MLNPFTWAALLLLVFVAGAASAAPEADHFLWQDGQTIVFLGDSITEQTNSRGYVDTAHNLCSAVYPDRRLNFVNAGIGGERVQDMIDRAPKLFQSTRTDWIVLFAGMNDVDADPSGNELAQFRDRYHTLAVMCKEAAHGNVLLMTIAVEEPLSRKENTAVRMYSEVVRQIGRELGLRVANVDGAMFTAIRRGTSVDPKFALTVDGVHMNPVGATLLASVALGAVGFSRAAIPDIEDWRALQEAERARARTMQREAVDMLARSFPSEAVKRMEAGTPLDVKTLTPSQRGLLDMYVNPLGYSSINLTYRDTRAADGTLRIYHHHRRRHVAIDLAGPGWTLRSDEEE